MPTVVQRLIERAAHHAGRGNDDVETRQVRHLDQGGDTASFRTYPARPGAVVLDFTRCVGTVAALVLKALDMNAIARAVGKRARREKAGHAGAGARKREKTIAHRRRAEPLVALKRIG